MAQVTSFHRLCAATVDVKHKNSLWNQTNVSSRFLSFLSLFFFIFLSLRTGSA